jgi:hypothetical protein
MIDSAPDDDPSWSHYSKTILAIRCGEKRLDVDLRALVVDDVRRELRDLGTRPSFGVVTAANPDGRKATAGENETRYAHLRAQIAAEDYSSCEADGLSPDGSHRERGFVVWGAMEEVRALAGKYEQTAFFWFDGESFWLVATGGKPEPIKLPA